MPSFDAGKIEGTADLDLTPFHLRLDEAEARAESFEAHTYTAKLGLDDSEGLRHLFDMRDRLDEYAARDYIAKVGVDTGTGRTDIEALRREIDSLDKTVHVRVVTSGGAGTSGGASGGGGGDLFSSLRSGLLGTAIALSPGAIPLAGVAGAGLLGTAGGLGVAGAGLGAFGLAAAPEVKQLSTAMTQLTAARTSYNKAVLEGSKTGEHDALAQQKNILAGLNAEQKTALGGLIAFQGAYKSFQHDLQPTVLLVLQDVLTTASHLLPIVEPLAKATGTALDGIVRGFDHQISGGGLASFIQSLSKDVGPDLRLVATIIENLATDGGRLLLALQPLALTVLPALDRATRGLGTGSGLEHFLSYAISEAPVVGHALSGILGLAGSLVEALAPLGGAVLVGVGNLARTLSHDLSSPAFAGFVHDLARTVPPLASGMGHLAGAAVTLLHDFSPLLPVIAGLAADVATLVDDLGPLPGMVLGVWAAFKGYSIVSDAVQTVVGFGSTAALQFKIVSGVAASAAATTATEWEAAMASATISAEDFVAAADASFASIVGTAGVDGAAAGGAFRASMIGALGPIAAFVGVGTGVALALGAAAPGHDLVGDVTTKLQNKIKGDIAAGIKNGTASASSVTSALQQSGLTPDQVPGAGLFLAAAHGGLGAGTTSGASRSPDFGTSSSAAPASTKKAAQVVPPGTTGSSLLSAFGSDPGGGGSGSAATAAQNAQLVDYQQQIGTGLASAIKRGVPAVQQETIRLRDTILREFKNPAAARERQQALALLAQEAPKALNQAQANAHLAAAQLGKTITAEITKSVQSGAPAVLTEITKLQGEVLRKLSGEGQAAERKQLLADLQRDLPIFKGYATQYAALQTALAADKTRLAALQSQATQFRDTAYTSLSGGASLTAALSSGQGITGYLGNQLTVLQSFVGQLHALKAARIGPAAMEMIVAAGPAQGGAIARALLASGTTGQASSLVDAIQTLAGSAADDVQHEVYDPQIASVVAAQQATTKAVTDLNATILKAGQTTGKTLAQGLTGTARTAKQKGTVSTKPKKRASLR